MRFGLLRPTLARTQMVNGWLDSNGISDSDLRARVFTDLERPQIVNSGEALPNYTIKAPSKLTTYENSTTVEDPTKLSEILKPDSGCIALATCTK